MTHQLKIEKQWADAKLAGEKPFEIRKNDRGFQKGDIVRYSVIDPKTREPWQNPSGEPHTLEQCEFIITYMLQGFVGLEQGYCVFADLPVRDSHKDRDLRVNRLWDRIDELEEKVRADANRTATPSDTLYHATSDAQS